MYVHSRGCLGSVRSCGKVLGLAFVVLLTACSGMQSSEPSDAGGLWDEVQRLEADISQVVPKPTVMPPDMSAIFASELDGQPSAGQYLVVYAHSGFNVALCHSGPSAPCAAGEFLRKVVFRGEELFMYLIVLDKVAQSMEIGAVREFWNSVEFSEEIPSR